MSIVVPFIVLTFVSLKVFVILIRYYEYSGNRVVLAGLNRFTMWLSFILLAMYMLTVFSLSRI